MSKRMYFKAVKDAPYLSKKKGWIKLMIDEEFVIAFYIKTFRKYFIFRKKYYPLREVINIICNSSRLLWNSGIIDCLKIILSNIDGYTGEIVYEE